jgi:hypothetical protein
MDRMRNYRTARAAIECHHWTEGLAEADPFLFKEPPQCRKEEPSGEKSLRFCAG